MKTLNSLLALLLLTATVACKNLPSPPSSACSTEIKTSQSRPQAQNEKMVESIIALLEQKTPQQLRPTTAEQAGELGADLRSIVLQLREISSSNDGSPIPITAGAGFATLNALGQAENLFGIYQANTPSGVCNYPFAPQSPLPLNPDDPNSETSLFTASPLMRNTCQLLGSCEPMSSPIFLNISNQALLGHNRKHFYNNGLFDLSGIVFETNDSWKPGGTQDNNTNWVLNGANDFQNNELNGKYVIYLQSDMNDYILLFYKPFANNEGEFAGTAYSFVNLHEEFLVNTTYQSAVSQGICQKPTRRCTN